MNFEFPRATDEISWCHPLSGRPATETRRSTSLGWRAEFQFDARSLFAQLPHRGCLDAIRSEFQINKRNDITLD